MQLSYSVIKSPSVDITDSKEIKTDYIDKEITNFNQDNKEFVADRTRESLSNISNTILEKAKQEKEKIILEAYKKAKLIEQESYEKAYKEGLCNGKEDGYKEAYEANIDIAKKEAEEIRNEAYNLLANVRKEYEEYLESKRKEIIDLAYGITEHLLEKTIVREDGINDFISRVLEESRESKTFIIRCNKIHKQKIEEEVEDCKINSAITSDVFVIEDNSIKEGNALINLDGGLVEVGIDKMMESIKKELFY